MYILILSRFKVKTGGTTISGGIRIKNMLFYDDLINYVLYLLNVNKTSCGMKS